MSQKTIRKKLLFHKSSLSNPDNNVEWDRLSHTKTDKSVHYSTSGLKKKLKGDKELSTKKNINAMSATISPLYPNEITNDKKNGNNKNRSNSSRQDLELMKIFTSPEWSKNPYYKSTNSVVSSMVNDDNISLINTELENVLSKTDIKTESMTHIIQKSTDQEIKETDYAKEKKNVSYHPSKSFHSVRPLETEEKEYRECNEKEEISLNHDSVVSTSNLSSEEVEKDVAFMKYFNFDDFSDSYGSEIVDPSPTGSLNTDVMIRVIRRNKSRNYTTEKQMSNESAFREAMGLMFEEIKVSLGTLLVEGLYIASKRRRRQDALKYLGKWLLVQADIRDENHIEEESTSSF